MGSAGEAALSGVRLYLKMNGKPPAYRKWLALFALGVSIFNIAAPLSDTWDEILSGVILAILLVLLGPIWWEERRERKADRAA